MSKRCCVADAAAADSAPRALHVGVHERRLRPVLANDEHSLARLSTHPLLLRQGRSQLNHLLTLFSSQYQEHFPEGCLTHLFLRESTSRLRCVVRRYFLVAARSRLLLW